MASFSSFKELEQVNPQKFTTIAEIQDVVKDSQAQSAGLLKGDLIVGYARIRINGIREQEFAFFDDENF